MNAILDFLADLTPKKALAAFFVIYAIACIIDLFAPIGASRGSWWNAFAGILRLICVIGG